MKESLANESDVKPLRIEGKTTLNSSDDYRQKKEKATSWERHGKGVFRMYFLYGMKINLFPLNRILLLLKRYTKQ